MLTRIAFPFNVVNGTLEIHQGTAAAAEALRMLLYTNTGEMPLSRDYGADLEYNIPLESARQQQQQLVDKLNTYHPQISLSAMTPVISDDGVIIDWQISVSVEDVQ